LRGKKQSGRSKIGFSASLPSGKLEHARSYELLEMHETLKTLRIRMARPSDCEQLARMCTALWPDSSAREHARDLLPILQGKPRSTLPVTILVAEVSPEKREETQTEDANQATLVGFLEVGLRSHADGCDASHAVGFVEGWYVIENERHRGVGRKLVAAAEEWARSQGCTEMASDTWIDNTGSHRAHEAIGYEEVDRCVHYRKKLGKN
jgi:aminoglycoside 6'-N-acetyltransferase I